MRAIADHDLGAGCPGVLERVGQRLLHDPVGGEVDAGGQGPRDALHDQLRRQARRPHLVEQGGELAKARQRRQGRPGSLGVSQDPKGAAHLGHRLVGGGLDRGDRLPGPGRVGVGVQHQPGRPGLDPNHAKAVGHHVVQFAGDPQALLGCCLPGLLLPFPLQSGGPVLQRGGMGAPLPDAFAQGPGGAQEHEVVEHVVEVGDGDVRPGRHDQLDQADGEQQRPDHYAQDGQPTVTVGRQRVQGEVHPQEGEQRALQLQVPLDPERQRGDGEHRERGPPSEGQGEGLKQDERDVEGAAVLGAGVSLHLGQGEPGGHQRQHPVCHQGVQPGQPGTEGAPSVHGQTLAATVLTRIPHADDRHASGFIPQAEAG
jgi:hypothetical protein